MSGSPATAAEFAESKKNFANAWAPCSVSGRAAGGMRASTGSASGAFDCAGDPRVGEVTPVDATAEDPTRLLAIRTAGTGSRAGVHAAERASATAVTSAGSAAAYDLGVRAVSASTRMDIP